jgi:hypothetical protein
MARNSYSFIGQVYNKQVLSLVNEKKSYRNFFQRFNRTKVILNDNEGHLMTSFFLFDQINFAQWRNSSRSLLDCL